MRRCLVGAPSTRRPLAVIDLATHRDRTGEVLSLGFRWSFVALSRRAKNQRKNAGLKPSPLPAAQTNTPWCGFGTPRRVLESGSDRWRVGNRERFGRAHRTVALPADEAVPLAGAGEAAGRVPFVAAGRAVAAVLGAAGFWPEVCWTAAPAG